MEQAIDRKSVFPKRFGVMKKLRKMMRQLLIEKKGLLLLIGFLLGRAAILFSISPFAIAFLAAVWLVYGRRMFLFTTFVILGAWTHSIEHGVLITISSLIFFIFTLIFNQYKKVSYTVAFIFFSIVLTRIFIYSLLGELTIYQFLTLLVESGLSIVLLLIFMQSVPFLLQQKYYPTLKSEELICLIILFASILTGLIGWNIYGVAFEHVLSRYIVLTLAFVGGAAIGSTVGVVTGLILSLASITNLYQMSLLAFSGLLGGLLREGKKVGTSIGLFVGTFLVGVYGEFISFTPALYESIVSIILFFLTPAFLLQRIERQIPGTAEHSLEERKYMQRMRDVTAQRVDQFSQVFATLSKSFFLSSKKQFENEEYYETDYLLSFVTEKTCQACFMKKRCWQYNFDKTYMYMESIKKDVSSGEQIEPSVKAAFAMYCIKSEAVMQAIEQEVTVMQANKQYKRQVDESKRFVADQLKGVSDVMDNFAKEMLQERKEHEKQEVQIFKALKQMDLQIEKINIYRLEKGDIDIEITIRLETYHGEGPKLIAPVLSDIMKETVIVTEEQISSVPYGLSILTLGSAKKYTVQSGVASAAEGGGLISGDAYTLMELGKGKYAIAISDGMGNGLRAREESMETLRLLKQMLQTGISEQVAIKSINSLLSLRTTDEIFATLDLAIINLHSALVRCLKIGSVPSFIKRGEEVRSLQAGNLPIGIIESVDIDVVQHQLKSGDFLIMMSDGVFDAPKHIHDNERWLKRKIAQMKTEDPQAIADLLLEEVIRGDLGAIRDDMTIVVTKINTFHPTWAAIPAIHYKAT